MSHTLTTSSLAGVVTRIQAKRMAPWRNECQSTVVETVVEIDDSVLCDLYWCQISDLFDREAPSGIRPQSWHNTIFQITSAQYKPQTIGIQ